MRLTWFAVPMLLLATGCSSGTSTTLPSLTPSATPTRVNLCDGASPGPGCLTSTPGTTTTYPYPADAGRISPLAVPGLYPGELKRITNNLTPRVRVGILTVVIAPGKALATHLICQGRGTVSLSTRPASKADLTLTCDGNADPSELDAVAPAPETKSTTFVITVRAAGPSRWLAAVVAQP